MKNQHDIEHILNNKIPSLDGAEREMLWKKIEMKITEKSIPSPFAFTFNKIYMMPAAAFAIILILGVGTSAAAQQSRPGDILFPVERALEEVRLALAVNNTEKASLQIKYAEERLAEMRSLLEGKQTSSSAATSTVIKFEGEADVFSDITLVKVEINDIKKQFSTQAKSREQIVAEIVSRYGIAKEIVEANLEIEEEDRSSRVSDISKDTEDDVRVKKSVELISSLVDEINDDERKRFVRDILNTLDDGGDVRIEVKHDDEDHEEDYREERIEIRTDSERIRIREKDDGEVRVEIRNEDYDDDRDDDRDDSEERELEEQDNDSDDRDEDDTNGSKDEVKESTDEKDDSSSEESEEVDDSESKETESISKLEVRVKDNVAEVRMEYNDDDLDFKTPYTTRDALIATISLRSGLSEALIEDSIEIEIDN